MDVAEKEEGGRDRVMGYIYVMIGDEMIQSIFKFQFVAFQIGGHISLRRPLARHCSKVIPLPKPVACKAREPPSWKTCVNNVKTRKDWTYLVRPLLVCPTSSNMAWCQYASSHAACLHMFCDPLPCPLQCVSKYSTAPCTLPPVLRNASTFLSNS